MLTGLGHWRQRDHGCPFSLASVCFSTSLFQYLISYSFLVYVAKQHLCTPLSSSAVDFCLSVFPARKILTSHGRLPACAPSLFIACRNDLDMRSTDD